MSNSSTIIRVPSTGHDYSRFVSPAPHPGEHLAEDYLPDYGLTAETLAKAMGLADAQPIRDLLEQRIDLDADMALRLGKVFNQSPNLWMGLQNSHDLSKAAIAKRDELALVRPLAAA